MIKIKMIFICPILALIIISCQKHRQISYPEYYRNFDNIINQLYSSEMKPVLAKFDSISSRIHHVPSYAYYKIATACAENNLCELAAFYFEKSLQNGKEYAKSQSAISKGKCFAKIDEVLNKEAEIHRQNFNFRYKALIDSLFVVDQKIRSDSSYDMKSIIMIDSLNMYTLLHYIEKFGYPSEKLVGDKSAFDAYIMLLHMDRDKNNKILLPIIHKAYNEGYLDPIGFAWIIDRRRAWGDENLEPYYYHIPSKKYDSLNNEQINEINRRRDSIGLRPK
jgi:hypothetical protein